MNRHQIAKQRWLAGPAALAVALTGMTGGLASASPRLNTTVGAQLSATAPSPFGNMLVGQFAAQDITVHNSGPTSDSINLATSSNSGGSLDFLPQPAMNPTLAAPSCLTPASNGSLTSNPIPSGGSCTLGLIFLPTHFGSRATTATVTDTNTNTAQFTLNMSGTGVAGYYLAGASAEYTTFGFAPNDLESAGMALNKPVVGISGTSGGGGFWLDATDGGVFTAGSAGFFGSRGGQPLNKPVDGMAGTPTDNGYWLVASDGGIFTYGDAGFFGSRGGQPLNKPIVGMAATPTGRGYWLVASDGGIFTYGDAGFFGSTGSMRLNKPIVGMAATPTGRGYWLVASDGGIFTFGEAGFYGSTGSLILQRPIVGMAASPTGRGYWLVASDGGIFTFGDVPFEGSLGGQGFDDVVGMAPTTSPLFGPFLSAPANLSGRAAAVATVVRGSRARSRKSSVAAAHR